MDRPIIFSAPMVRALLDGRKTQTRRVFSHQWTVLGSRWGKNAPWAGLDFGNAVRGRLSGAGLPDAHLSVPWLHPEDAARGARWEDDRCMYRVRPPYDIGDRLWVREAWRLPDDHDGDSPTAFVASLSDLEPGPNGLVRFEADGCDAWGEQYNSWLAHGRLRAAMHLPRMLSRLTLLVTDVRVQRLQEISEADAEAEGVFRHLAEHSIDKVFRSERGATAIAYFRDLWNSLHGADAWQANPWVAAVTFECHRSNIDAPPLPPPSASEQPTGNERGRG